jgi:putative tricarboxylic transport membrane protein
MSRVSKLVTGTIAAGLFALTATAAFAQLGDLKIIAPAAPGGGWDQTARSLQSAMVAAGAAKSVQVINVLGAGGTVGLSQVVNSKGDGNTLMVNGFVMVGAILLNKSPVNLSQVTPIARLTEEAEVVVVPADSPIKNAKDLADAIKKDVSKVTFAGGSAGGVDHILAGQIVKAAGADAAKVNYIPFSGGGESLAAILGGKVTVGISGYGEYEGQIKAGKLRAVGVSSEKRLANAPDVPTLKEQGVDVVTTNWRSVMAAPGLSAEDKKKLSDAVEKTVKSAAWKEILKQKGWDDAYLASDQFGKFLAQEQERVTEVMKAIGLVKG